MLKIRLQRVGRKHDPSYRVVLTDSRRVAKSGGFITVLGNYNPRQKDATKLDGAAITEWIGKGAQVSGTVNNLLVNRGVVKGEKRNVIHVNRIKAKLTAKAPKVETAPATASADVAPAGTEQAVLDMQSNP